MSLLDLIVLLGVVVIGHFVAIPWGIVIVALLALIFERLARGERL